MRNTDWTMDHCLIPVLGNIFIVLLHDEISSCSLLYVISIFAVSSDKHNVLSDVVMISQCLFGKSFFSPTFFDFVLQNQPIFLISSYEISQFLKFENLKYDMCARKYGMCARKYGPLRHQTDKIRNDVISSYEVPGLHITAP